MAQVETRKPSVKSVTSAVQFSFWMAPRAATPLSAVGLAQAEVAPRKMSPQLCCPALWLLLLISWQLAPSAQAMNTTPDGSGYILSNVASSIDGLDCVTTDAPAEEPVVVADKSAGWPDSSDLGPSVSVDRAALPKRLNKKPLHFAESHFEIVTIHEFVSEPVLVFPIHCFYCLHEHIRERALPPLA